MGLHKVFRDENLRQCWLLTGIVASVAILLQWAGDDARNALAYDRLALADGQFWRLVTGHFMHLGWSHLFLNLAGLALVTWVVGNAFDWIRWATTGLVSIAVIDAGFWFLDPGLSWYVGLSGLLHGLLIAGLFVGIRNRNTESMVLTVLVLAKLAWEQIGGPLPGSEATSGGAVIVDAHLYGSIGGLLAAILLWRSVRPAAQI